jgi:hypothetical protein
LLPRGVMGEEDTEEAMAEEDTEADTILVVDITAGVTAAVRPIAAEPFITPRQHTTVQVQPLTALPRLARVLP